MFTKSAMFTKNSPTGRIRIDKALRRGILHTTFSYLNKPFCLVIVVWTMPLPYCFHNLGSRL